MVPGDKSISHRALLLSAFAAGDSAVLNMNRGADVGATVSFIRSLGAQCDVSEDKGLAKVKSSGRTNFTEPPDVIDCGNSGTTMRCALGVCAGIHGLSSLTGDDTLRRRPMLRVVAPLRQMGATIEGRRHGELAPLTIRGGALEGVDLDIDVASAQVKTALLLAGLAAEGTTSVREPAASRDHTERMLSSAGVTLQRSERTVGLEGGQDVEPRRWEVPGDISSAMFLIVAAVLVPGSDLTVEGVGLNPTRAGALEALRAMGADLEISPMGQSGGEPFGNVRVRSSDLRGITLGPEGIPSLIDELPVLAVAAARAEGETVIRGAGELRTKESDRIESIVSGLVALGASAEATRDGMVVSGPARLTGGSVSSHGDHRVALSFAVAGLVAAERVRVEGWSCVDTSFPEFLDVLGRAQGAA
jgi:3-phosphoshikimate 1-carboxyvinyltransferase